MLTTSIFRSRVFQELFSSQTKQSCDLRARHLNRVFIQILGITFSYLQLASLHRSKNTSSTISSRSQETKFALSHHASRCPRASSQHSRKPRVLRTRHKLHDLSRRLRHAEHFDRNSRVGNSPTLRSWAGIIMHSHLASNQQQLPCLPVNRFPPETASTSRAWHHGHRQGTHGHGPGPAKTCDIYRKNGPSPDPQKTCDSSSKNGPSRDHDIWCGIKRFDGFVP